MNGALVGFRIDGVNKLMRLHGEGRCERLLSGLLAYLRSASDAHLQDCARALAPDGSGAPGSPAPPQDWSEDLLSRPELSAWHAGFPCLPGAELDSCGDISWAFLINLDAGQLQVFINRHGHYHWRELADQLPLCAMRIEVARRLCCADATALHEVLHAHSYSNGLDPVLPVADGLSPPFAGPGRWTGRIRLRNQRPRLLLSCGELEVEVGMLGEMKLDHAGCGAFLYQAIAEPARSLACAIYGPGMNLAQAARVAARIQELPFHPEDSGLPLLELGLRPSLQLSLELGPGYFDALRARFLAAGMCAQGWRFLVRQSPGVLRSILGFFLPSARQLREFGSFINLLASALQGQRLRPERCQSALRGAQRILEGGKQKALAIREENARIYLRCLMRAALTPGEEANLVHEAQQVSDFLRAQALVLPGQHIGWHSLCRRSQAWHKAALANIAPERDVHWPALLPQFCAGGYVALELDSGARLAEEGLDQKHCVGSYANACASGSCRVFSLRAQGKRLATLELRRECQGQWRVGQLRGKANSIINDPAMLEAANMVAAAYSNAAGVGRSPE